jgi:hypothetical protein
MFRPFAVYRMKTLKIKFLYTAGLAAVLLGACHPEPEPQELYDELVISTNYDPNANFGAYVTYALPTDTIGLSSNSTSDTILVAKASDYPRPVLQAIESAMNERGYKRVGRNENPDLGMNVFVVTDINVFQQVVYPNPYYSGYGGYYGYSSYYYYPYINTYVSHTGALIIEMVDLKNKTTDNKVKVVWNAYLGDVYGTINLIDESVSGIDQAFKQSPYIGIGL